MERFHSRVAALLEAERLLAEDVEFIMDITRLVIAMEGLEIPVEIGEIWTIRELYEATIDHRGKSPHIEAVAWWLFGSAGKRTVARLLDAVERV